MSGSCGIDAGTDGDEGGRAQRARRRSRRVAAGWIVIVVLASVFLAWTVGFGVELLQAPLAARTTSVTDVIVNGIGAIAGGGLRTVAR